MKSKYEPTGDPIDQLVAKVIESPKYATINQGLIRRIAVQEFEKRNNLREAMKSIKNKLHQVGGAYLDRPMDYPLFLMELTTAFHEGKEEFRRVCQRVMCYHSSTRERLPELDWFYRNLLVDLPPVRHVIDVACGLNPLAIPWMGLSGEVEYIAIDIYSDMMNFISQYMTLIGVQGSAVVGDVLGYSLPFEADVAFVLKTIPCLEQVDKNAGAYLLDGLQAKYIIVSFPVHSLGGRRDKGMLVNYANRFKEITINRHWSVKRYEYKTELVFVVRK